MNREIYVEVRADYVASLASASPLVALEELIWNALDAEAREVRIDVLTNALGGIDGVRISDDGIGIAPDSIEATFGSLGGSWKRDTRVTEHYGRPIHGRRGRGRFKAFALGTRVTWTSTTVVPAGGLRSMRIMGDLSMPGFFQLEDVATGPACGTEVLAVDVRANATTLLDAGAAVQVLAAKFAPYLKSYPNVRIYFSGIPVTPVIVQKSVTTYSVRTSFGGEAQLDVIEWRRRFPGAGRLVFCDADGFSLRELPAGVRPGAAYAFTAYLTGQRFAALHAESALLMEELNPEVRSYVEAARSILRDHFRVRATQAANLRLADWIKEGSYPYSGDENSPTRARFDEKVNEMRQHLDGFDAFSASERTYLFGLLKKVTEAQS